MKKQLMVVSVFIFLAYQACAADAPAPNTDQEKMSYAIGVSTARNLKKSEMELNTDFLVKGLKDGLAGEKLLMPEKDVRKAVNAMINEVRRKTALNQRMAALDNRKKGEEFLAANKAKEGVVTLPSGVQYKILKAGDGKKPTDGQSVECFYRGTLLDGTEFDGTEADKPATLKVSQLIAGWKEALKLMPEGSKWQIFIPANLAYGERGVGSDIGPNETLVFEVELVRVKDM